MIALSSRRSLYIRNIASRIWLGNTKTEPQFSSSHTWQPSLALLFRSESGNGRASYAVPASETPAHATPAHAIHLVCHYCTTPRVPLVKRYPIRKLYTTSVGRVLDGVGDSEAELAVSKADFFGDLACSFPFLGVWQ